MKEGALACAVGVALAAGCMAGSFNGLTADIASTTFWYQAEPHAPFPKLPSADELVMRHMVGAERATCSLSDIFIFTNHRFGRLW